MNEEEYQTWFDHQVWKKQRRYSSREVVGVMKLKQSQDRLRVKQAKERERRRTT